MDNLDHLNPFILADDFVSTCIQGITLYSFKLLGREKQAVVLWKEGVQIAHKEEAEIPSYVGHLMISMKKLGISDSTRLIVTSNSIECCERSVL